MIRKWTAKSRIHLSEHNRLLSSRSTCKNSLSKSVNHRNFRQHPCYFAKSIFPILVARNPTHPNYPLLDHNFYCEQTEMRVSQLSNC